MVDPWLRPGSGRHRRSGDHAEHQGDRSDEDEAGVCALRQRKRQKYVSKAWYVIGYFPLYDAEHL